MLTDRAPLIELAQQVRHDTLRFLSVADESWLTWAPPGTSNHLLWHAGHTLWVQDVLFVEVVTGQSELPAGWAATFGMDGRPVKATDANQGWPHRAEIEQRLREQLPRVRELVQDQPANAFAADAPPVLGSRNLLSCYTHAWHDEAKHQGEMYLLIKLLRAQR